MTSSTRRDFLRIGSLAFGGLNLPALLSADAGKSERACIVIFQNGGASQLDFFDPKPDAPADIRGSFGTTPTSVPGIHFSGLLPRTAKALNKFAVIRSMHSDEAIHERARQYIFSGTKPRNDLLHPSYGSVMSKELGGRHGLPPFVVIPEKDLSAEAGFLGSAHDPFITGDPNAKNFSVKDLTLPTGVSPEESQARRSLLEKMDREFHKATASPLLSDMDEFTQKALDLISSPAARKAFDIQAEPGKLRDAYGRTGVGQGCLLARRLIESGTRLATVFHGGYDTHREHEKGVKRFTPDFDQAFPTLLDDLDQRGLLATTLVLVIGDFGRTPKINFSGGRDHWPRGFSVALAGAGILGGVVVGRSDAQAGEPADRPVTIEDLGATVYKALGIDAQKEYHANGRPVRINKDGVVVKELFA
ncbi:MAG TPA: DUF1501 domain-containing protein [Bryobacteraceae bacterium]|nr:DUF1501 domain-containing protein [Bryobacteraceae bacterium]